MCFWKWRSKLLIVVFYIGWFLSSRAEWVAIGLLFKAFLRSNSRKSYQETMSVRPNVCLRVFLFLSATEPFNGFSLNLVSEFLTNTYRTRVSCKKIGPLKVIIRGVRKYLLVISICLHQFGRNSVRNSFTYCCLTVRNFVKIRVIKTMLYLRK